jgi:hypothetical protein
MQQGVVAGKLFHITRVLRITLSALQFVPVVHKYVPGVARVLDKVELNALSWIKYC